MVMAVKIIIAASLITFSSWLAGKKPYLAGFIVALPISSLIAIAFSYFEHKNVEYSVEFAKGILLAVPVSYLFFIPFFFADKFNNQFWLVYATGVGLLIIGYFIHKAIIAYFT
jgi:hypothetical protein